MACICSLRLCQSNFAQTLTDFATRRTLALVIMLEIMTCLYLGVFMVLHQSVTLLGLYRGYIHYVAIIVVRMICAVVMWLGILCRKVRTVRLMTMLFTINSIVSIYTLVPFFRAKCSCSTYFQCQVLYSFAAGNQGAFINPRNIEEPGWMKDRDCKPNGFCFTSFGTHVHVKYTEQPPMKTTSSFMQENFITRRVAHRGHELVPISAGLLSAEHLRHQHNNHANMRYPRTRTRLGIAAGGVMRTFNVRRPRNRGISSLEIGATHDSDKPGFSKSLVQHTEDGEGTKVASKSSTIGKREQDNLNEVEILYGQGAMDAFDKGSEKIEWRQDDGTPHCSTVSWSDAKLAAFENILPEFWEKKKKPQDIPVDVLPAFVDLNAQIQQCWSLSDCMVVGIAQKKDVQGNGNVQLCCFMRHSRPTVFTPYSPMSTANQMSGFPEDIQSYVRVVANFEKKTLETNRLAQSYMTREQVLNQIDQAFKSECRCKREGEGHGGCMASRDPSTQKPAYWCYLENVAACEKQENVEQSFDIEILYAADGKPWTKDLCSTNCKCQDQGIPYADNEEVADVGIWENGANFGSSCKAWTKDDPREWCYVGVDSPCSDRRLSTERQGWGFRFYWSRVACMDADTQFSGTWLINHVGLRCKIWTNVAWMLQAFIVLLTPPVVFMSYQYVSNRCGDAIDEADIRKFTIESSDEDDFDYRETGPN